MRCLLVADLHYSLPQLDWVVQVAGGFDLVILAGDLLDLGSIVDYHAQIVVAQAYLGRIAQKTHVIVCSGNHDLDSLGPDGEKIASWIGDASSEVTLVDGASLLHEDTLFTICPWWDGPKTKDRLESQLARDAKRRASRWIWVHHAPPSGSPTSWTGSRSLGDADLDRWIRLYQPDLVLTGHVHQSPFVRDGSWADQIGVTWVFNAGHQFGAPPAHVIFDTRDNRAVWISAMGVQMVDLRGPLERPIAPLHEMPDWVRRNGDRDPNPA